MNWMGTAVGLYSTDSRDSPEERLNFFNAALEHTRDFLRKASQAHAYTKSWTKKHPLENYHHHCMCLECHIVQQWPRIASTPKACHWVLFGYFSQAAIGFVFGIIGFRVRILNNWTYVLFLYIGISNKSFPSTWAHEAINRQVCTCMWSLYMFGMSCVPTIAQWFEIILTHRVLQVLFTYISYGDRGYGVWHDRFWSSR